MNARHAPFTGGLYIDEYGSGPDPRVRTDDFYDAFHLQRPVAQRLSGIIAEAIRADSARGTKAAPAGVRDRQPDMPSMSLGAPPDLKRAGGGDPSLTN